MPTRVIQVDSLARVEGEGALFIQLSGKTVLDVKLKIFEPPRFFEAATSRKPPISQPGSAASARSPTR
jgi:coenzyme F420-reducing hydrogenase alpha subunit